MDKVGEMFCLGYCYDNHAFHYDGENYAGNDIQKIDQIVKGDEEVGRASRREHAR